MTLEEKRNVVDDYCKTHNCNECVLNHTNINCVGCLSISNATESELDTAISFIEGRVAPATDPVNRPSHYTDGKIEVIDYIEDKKLGFCLGNAIKYISRAGKKDPSKEIEDLKKAKWYIERRIKEIEEGIA